MLSVKQNIGPLDRRITIQSPIITDNETNENEESGWTTETVVWGEVKEAKGNIGVGGSTLETVYQSLEVVIRFIQNVTEGWRLIIDGREYKIDSIQEVGRRRFTRLVVLREKQYNTGAGDFNEDFNEDFST